VASVRRRTIDPTSAVRDIAVDFVEMNALLDRVQAAFFRDVC
jgi:hypothetical protein